MTPDPSFRGVAACRQMPSPPGGSMSRKRHRSATPGAQAAREIRRCRAELGHRRRGERAQPPLFPPPQAGRGRRGRARAGVQGQRTSTCTCAAQARGISRARARGARAGEAFDASAVLIEDKASGTQLMELIAEGLYAVTRCTAAGKRLTLPQRFEYTSQPLALRLSTQSRSAGDGARLYSFSTRSLTALRQIRQRRNWWIYALLISTIIPSLVDLGIGGASLVRRAPGLPSVLLRRIPVGRLSPPTSRAGFSCSNCPDILRRGFGMRAQAVLALGSISYAIERFHSSCSDMARSIPHL